MAGPFPSPPFHSFFVSPLGVAYTKRQDEKGDFRLIHHLSLAKGSSVKDGISSANTSVHYATVSDAIRLIKRGCFLAKNDIKNAFRIMPVHPNDYHLLGIEWRELYYYDKCLPMGCASSCKTFKTFSTAVEWIA